MMKKGKKNITNRKQLQDTIHSFGFYTLETRGTTESEQNSMKSTYIPKMGASQFTVFLENKISSSHRTRDVMNEMCF